MSSWAKFRAFWPQSLACALAVSCATGLEAAQAHPVLQVPLGFGLAIFGALAFVTTLAKANAVSDDGWEKVAGKCKSCAALKKENAALLEAIK